MKSKNLGIKGMIRKREGAIIDNANVDNFTNFINFVKYKKNCAVLFTLHFHTKQKNHLEYLLLSIK